MPPRSGGVTRKRGHLRLRGPGRPPLSPWTTWPKRALLSRSAAPKGPNWKISFLTEILRRKNADPVTRPRGLGRLRGPGRPPLSAWTTWPKTRPFPPCGAPKDPNQKISFLTEILRQKNVAAAERPQSRKPAASPSLGLTDILLKDP